MARATTTPGTGVAKPAKVYKHPRRHMWPPYYRRMFYEQRYQEYHILNAKYLPGKVKQPQINEVVKLVADLSRYGLEHPRLLDYGSGKGYQYLVDRIHERWGGLLPVCYDPGVFQLAVRPEGLFNGVICIDVLEHVEEFDLWWVIKDVFKYVDISFPHFVYFHICCRPARKSFPDGRNLHFTVRPPMWWKIILRMHAPKGANYVTTFELAQPKPQESADEDDPGDLHP